ncbi:MAG: hypothetical protein WC725_04035 [Patescibacteria group bacterium]|jgi:hypothetical protein
MSDGTDSSHKWTPEEFNVELDKIMTSGLLPEELIMKLEQLRSHAPNGDSTKRISAKIRALRNDRRAT